MLARIRVESETKTNVEITAYEALVIDAKIFEFKQLVADQRRLIESTRVDWTSVERERIVWWLRREASFTRASQGRPMLSHSERSLLLVFAACIERGGHDAVED
jgi:hypothetical protein